MIGLAVTVSCVCPVQYVYVEEISLFATLMYVGFMANSTHPSERPNNPVALWVVVGKKPEASTLSVSKYGFNSVFIRVASSLEMMFSTMTPPSRSIISRRRSVVVPGSFASHRASVGLCTAPLVNSGPFFDTIGVSTVCSIAMGAILRALRLLECVLDLIRVRFLYSLRPGKAAAEKPCSDLRAVRQMTVCMGKVRDGLRRLSDFLYKRNRIIS